MTQPASPARASCPNTACFCSGVCLQQPREGPKLFQEFYWKEDTMKRILMMKQHMQQTNEGIGLA